ncbi:MAG TPA: TetR/AcrR family transcriptional regulator [Yinghuangia sp.]|uniref:TetR/AcrR family transcriptional regulator n=1 Tax=Yinghuangia sp. YIM S10712 TaxID=3436930 RepID=UPI002CDECF7F|nr:TetR/AcrR family transcriptional regulator [Yinghuangia sp.]
MQHAALLDAARALLDEGGFAALTFPALAERTGLARSSVYEYFRSRAAVVEELCAVDLPAWVAEVEDAMAASDDPADKIAAYVNRQLELVGDRTHRVVVAISTGELDANARERIRAAHGRIVELVVSALADLGHPDPMLVASLVQGMVDAAVRRIECGADSAEVTAATLSLVLGGVAAVRPAAEQEPGTDHTQDTAQPTGPAAAQMPDTADSAPSVGG